MQVGADEGRGDCLAVAVHGPAAVVVDTVEGGVNRRQAAADGELRDRRAADAEGVPLAQSFELDASGGRHGLCPVAGDRYVDGDC